eukprot:CAMPEP_0202693758 /NCGR_PEP_ID=MMETSP1385-20130828/7793_1 /ASSEMBLY_ACC=CAM_ASM_000861 /TAXON_ID=933848 /ORGANISM="Elphidium margaritaceum" /LENGTH=570 /DNA_ID=CAMNT_0049349485 /DNA_START=128 /DNA_END=1840 /DNA_ORIENTATION=-
MVGIAALSVLGKDTHLNSESPAKNLVTTALHPESGSTSEYYKQDGADDLVTAVPGLLTSTCSDSPTNCEFPQYSGYLLANENREIHYWFFPAEENAPSKPVFIWTNGGPGCSGADGLYTEHGPWKALHGNQVAYNPYAWTTEVNLVYLEQPYGVGFSVAPSDDDVVTGDQNAADDMDAAIRDFINKFPAFADHDFYLSSESWGGNYVPMTTYTILQNNDAGVTPFISLKGFLLGNPYTDAYENAYGFVGGINGHGLMKIADWEQWRSQCWDQPDAIDDLTACSALQTKAYFAARNTNLYGLDFPQCYADENWLLNSGHGDKHLRRSQSQFLKNGHVHRAAHRAMKKVLQSQDYDTLNMGPIKRENVQALHDELESRFSLKKLSQSELSADIDAHVEFETADTATDVDPSAYEACIETFMSVYLNQDEVRTALHVKPTYWGMCNNAVFNSWPSSDYELYMQDYYTAIVDNYLDDLGLTLAVYSGDDDSVCGLQGTAYWLQRWGQANPDMEWQPWTVDGELCGSYTQYLADSGSVALHFMTVRSAGHMVPTTQPERALILLQKFLNEFVTSS